MKVIFYSLIEAIMSNYKDLPRFIIVLIILYSAYNKAYAATITNPKTPIFSFVNHELQILALRDKLQKTHKVGVTGISGKGKSELVKKYVEKYKDQYDIIAFFNSDVDLIPQFINLAMDINNNICKHETCNLSLSVDKVERSLMNFLTYRDKWLLIFDNIKLNQGHKIKKFMDWDNNGDIIVTSQDSRFIKNRIEMPYLKDNDAEDLIKIIMPDLPQNLIDKIIKKCRGHPYLLNHVTTFVSNYKHKNMDEIINYIENNNNPIEEFTNLLLNSISEGQKNLLLKISLMNNHEISKSLLSNISGDDKDNLIENIDELVRLGVLEQVSIDIEKPVFQLHDVLKSELIRKFPSEVHKRNSEDLLVSLINMLPPNDKTRAYVIISHDKTMISNLEKVLDNSNYYNADIHRSLELRTHVLDYYIDIRDPENCRKLVEWLNQKQDILGKMNDSQKDIYAYYLTKVGYYEEFANSNYSRAIDYYKKALDIATKAQPITKLIANWQLANAQISLGELDNALKSIQKAVLGQDPEVVKDNRIWYLQGRIFLAQGEYKKALDVVNEGLEIYMKANDKNSATSFNTQLFKAEILNYMGSYTKAYHIAHDIYLMDRDHLINCFATDIKVLIQLARAEHGLGMNEEALGHVEKAISYLRVDIDCTDSMDKNLADAFVVKGDVLGSLLQVKEAMSYYDKAENIYYNRFRQNIKNIDEVSYVLSQGAKLACKNNNKDWFDKFMGHLTHYFGINHKRVKETQEYCSQMPIS